ncbi:hypothetical protein BDB00DRAFT_345026 [Zychaea mexicana]|uniref:uncharacterized protein n=1 Tax=Zychaea mexicana TaxID=64656 RepID=UPI0022FEBA16|nr:uncharacterized protein BDB00DRAFT_345026 [Zychaea mexicana]KAI9494071.1 hypothetical protein BDB00DRAFT_345026 [Zychaea mexicana]
MFQSERERERKAKRTINTSDAVIGTIPVVGAFLDMFYKANLWNYEALQDYLDHMDMAAASAAASSTGPTTSAGSSASAATSKRYQDIATTEISWAQLLYDTRHLATTLIAWIYPTGASKMNNKD